MFIMKWKLVENMYIKRKVQHCYHVQPLMLQSNGQNSEHLALKMY